MLPGIFRPTARRRGIAGGSQSFTANGTFTVPSYNTLTVTAEGKLGASAPASPEGCGGGPGGNGGKAISQWTAGAAGAPTVGASITVTLTTAAIFGSSTNVRGNHGTSAFAGTWIAPTESQPGYCSGGSAGSAGTATGGNVSNTTGGSSQPTGRVLVEWT